jgi:phosphodiesterase/alkaline phosphatase D-like protein
MIKKIISTTVVFGMLVANFATGFLFVGASGTINIDTRTAINVTDTSATLQGKVITSGSGNATTWFEYDQSQYALVNGNASGSTNPTGSYGDNDNFHQSISNLNPDTIYWYRACGEDTTGVVDCGGPVAFQTQGAQGQGATVEWQQYQEDPLPIQEGHHTVSGPSLVLGASSSEDIDVTIRLIDLEADHGVDYDVTDGINGPSLGTVFTTTIESGYSHWALVQNEDIRIKAFADGIVDPNERFRLDIIDVSGNNTIGGEDTLTYIIGDVSIVDPVDDEPVIQTKSAINIGSTTATVRGCVGDDGDGPVTACFKYALTPQMTNATTVSVSGSYTTGEYFSKILTGLTPNTKYYYVACGNDTDGDYDQGSVMSFTTGPGVTDNYPVITTNNATNITTNSARLNGYVTEDGDGPVNTYFRYAKNSSLNNATVVNSTTEYTGEYFSKNITALTSNTTYWYQACGTDTDGDNDCGVIKSFTTGTIIIQDNYPTITTNNATNITTNSARLNGYVTEDGDGPVSACFEYATNSSLSNSTKVYVSGSYYTGQTFSKSISNLSQNTKYYYRACGEDSDGDYDHGSILSFTTENIIDPEPLIIIITNSATNIGTSTATLRGTVDEDGEGNVDACFELSRYSNLSNSTTYTVSGTYGDNDAFSKYITGLNDDTRYYYRACGEDQDGNYDHGSILSFKTDDYYNPSDDLEVNTRSATNIKEDEATLRGVITEEGAGDVRVWFEYDTDRDEVEDGDGRTVNVSGRYDDGDYFDIEIDDLRDDTKYYYRACGEDDDGDEDCGSIYSFRTDGDDSYDNLRVETENPTSIKTTSARLNGEIREEGAGDVKVWFELDTRYNDVEDGDGERYSVSGRYDDNDDFYKSVYDLNDNTRYYYRACGEDDDGDEDCGSVKSFTTGTERPETSLPKVVTGSATEITNTKAKIQGYFKANGCSINTYFMYGTNPNALVNKTTTILHGSEVGVVKQQLSNLTPGTRYYYRFEGQNCDGKDIGKVYQFVTKTYVTPVKPEPKPTPIPCEDPKETIELCDCEFDFEDLALKLGIVDLRERMDLLESMEREGGAGGSLVNITIDNDQDMIQKGEVVEYNVVLENISGTLEVEDIEEYIKLPENYSFLSATAGRYNKKDHALYVNAGDLDPREMKSMSFTVKPKNNLVDGDVVVVEAQVSYTHPISFATESATDLDADEYVAVEGSLTAGNGKFWPSTFWGWLLIILLLLLLFLIIRYFYVEARAGQTVVYSNDGPYPYPGYTPGSQPIPEREVFTPTDYNNDMYEEPSTVYSDDIPFAPEDYEIEDNINQTDVNDDKADYIPYKPVQ